MSQAGDGAEMDPADSVSTAQRVRVVAPASSAVPSEAVQIGLSASSPLVSFDRRELQDILNLYGRKVAEGEWRDYAMDFNCERAVFAIFRRASENALYRIEKEPALARKQGAFSVVSAHGLVLRRGSDLKRVLAVLEKKLKIVVW